MKYGLCVNHAPGVDRLSGIWHAEDLKKIGYDYIEVPTNIMNMLSEADFAEAKRILSESGLPCRTCNDFMPMTYRITGTDKTPRKELEAYIRRAFFRIGQNGLGAGITVFGSPWCRNCPDGYDFETAFSEVADFLRWTGEIAAEEGLTIAIESINRSETNMMNRIPDVARMVHAVDLPNVRMHSDYYHIRYEQEDPHVIEGFGDMIVHTHIAKLANRAYMTDTDGELSYLTEYADALKKIGYEGGMSLEAKPDPKLDWYAQAEANLRVLRSIFD